MTIQLFQTFNGIPAGVHTLAGAEETRLIGLGLARAWEPSIDGASFQDSDSIRMTSAQVAAANAAGNPVPRGTLLADPTTGQLYGQSDGAGGYEALGGSGGGDGGTSIGVT